MFDPYDARFAEILNDHYEKRPATAVSIKDFPVRPITAGERARFFSACDAAEAAGLRLPRVRLMVREAPSTVERGNACYDDDGAVTINLRADLDGFDWLAVAFHELQHAADFHDGTIDRVSLGVAELRAIQFSTDMMQRVQW